MIHHPCFLFSFLLCAPVYAQTYYVTVPINFPVGNKVFELNTLSCDSQEVFFCPPTNNILQYPENQFTDLAMDRERNLYYVTSWGSLYKQNLDDTTSCQFLGSFNSSINALVVDSDKLIYGTGQVNGICRLFRYDIATGIFDVVGILPNGFYSAGDLFFYERKLFLTGTSVYMNASYLVEVDVDNPSQSCLYMDFANLQPMSAFSVDYGSHSKAYILSTHNNDPSSLIELDMVNRVIGPTVCDYPFMAIGAAAYYARSSTISNCSPDLTSVQDTDGRQLFLSVQNPVTDLIRVTTDIDLSHGIALHLFDMTGGMIKSFDMSQLNNGMDVSDISAGMYLLQLMTSNGGSLTVKVVKQAF